MGILQWLGLKSKSENLKEALAQGAIIVDVRTPQEYKNGHVKGSVNIPLSALPAKLAKLKADNKIIITCCASGARSGNAAAQLNQNGIQAINGGPWTSVRAILK